MTMFELIYNLPEQIKKASQLKTAIRYPLSRIRQIVVSGMGGSGIGGEILQALLETKLKIPIINVKGYQLPVFVNKNTLFFAVSYSGDTEETLECFDAALKSNCHIIAVTSGGKLLELCKEYNISYIQLPNGLSPRCAIGYLFLPLFLSLSKLGLIKKTDKEINEAIGILYRNRKKYDNRARQLAKRLIGTLPLIYSTSNLLKPVAKRWQTQFNENAEIIALSNVFPELNHNEIVGIASAKPIAPLYFLLLIDPNTHPRNILRLKFTFRVIKKSQKSKVKCQKFFPAGKSDLARIFSLIMLGDLISYHLAKALGVKPESISAIDELKRALTKARS